MGKRVNLADLASDEPYAPASSRGTSSNSTATPLAAISLTADEQSRQTVPLSSVCANPLNKRPPGADEQMQEMAETIRAHGLIQPLVVCSAAAYLANFPQQHRAVGDADWVALIGNRRLLAAELAGLEKVTILVNDDQVSSMYEVMLIENGQRLELPPLMEAEAMAEALQAAKLSQAELARRIGKSKMYVSQRLTLLGLIPEFRELLQRGQLKIEAARTLGDLSVDEQRAILDAGPPYRPRPARAGRGTRPVSIRVSSPAVAAESIRSRFSDEELAELVTLLSQHLRTAGAEADTR